jgi:hypothetical protein
MLHAMWAQITPKADQKLKTYQIKYYTVKLLG